MAVAWFSRNADVMKTERCWFRPCDRPWQAVGSHLNQQRSVARLFVKPSPDDWCKGLTEIVYAWPLLYTIYHPIFLISLLSLLNTT